MAELVPVRPSPADGTTPTAWREYPDRGGLIRADDPDRHWVRHRRYAPVAADRVRVGMIAVPVGVHRGGGLAGRFPQWAGRLGGPWSRRHCGRSSLPARQRSPVCPAHRGSIRDCAEPAAQMAVNLCQRHSVAVGVGEVVDFRPSNTRWCSDRFKKEIGLSWQGFQWL
jgi:hypothetical protein